MLDAAPPMLKRAHHLRGKCRGLLELLLLKNSSCTVSSNNNYIWMYSGFESTLHEMECSDGQYISILRTWNGEQYACLTEIWRKYFPEVNRNHLTSALKRLELDTHMPTGQQATLLRSAGVISLRYITSTFTFSTCYI